MPILLALIKTSVKQNPRALNEENRMPTSEQTIIKRVTELVAADSVSSPDPSWDSSNRRVINHLSDYAERDGWAVDIHELESSADGKANLIATLGNTDNLGDEPAGLVLSGHTDTVPFDAGGWASDPLKLTERDGRLYGLGSTDMKGFFAVALEAASAFDPAKFCLLYTSPSPRDRQKSRMPSSA